MFLNIDEDNRIFKYNQNIYSIADGTSYGNGNDAGDGKMYPNKKLNICIRLGASILFGLVVTGLRTKTSIGDVQYMKTMISHYSSAIMVSKNVHLNDPEVIKLSEEIIASQEKEIAEMKAILARMKK